MVTKIINNSGKDITYYVPNIATYLSGDAMPPVKKVVKAGATAYDRNVTGDVELEAFLQKSGCVLSQVRRNYIVVVAGQSNAVGYDESAWDADDVKPVPFAYYDALKEHGGYGNASSVPILNPGIDTYQDMTTYGVGARTKGLHYELAKRLIGFVPDDYELEIWGYAYGGAGMTSGVVGSVNGSSVPQGSTKWGADGGLTIATGRRFNVHFSRLQPESKLLGIVWCQGEQDGNTNATPEAWAAGFTAMANKIQDLLANGNGNNVQTNANVEYWNNILFSEFQINTQSAYDQKSDPANENAFVEFTGQTFTASFQWKQFARNSFRTNLEPHEIQITFGSTQPDWQDISTFTNDRADNIEVKIDENGNFNYKLKDGTTRDKLPIYVGFINKLNNKGMGYVVINWGADGAIQSRQWTYKEANVKPRFRYPLWVVYPGPQKFWNKKGQYKAIINKQREMFSNFVELPEDLPTNNVTYTGTKAKSWKYYNGYGTTSAYKDSHYGQNAFRTIADEIVKTFRQALVDFAKDRKRS